MYSSLVIPGILREDSVAVKSTMAQREESVIAGMTIEQPVEPEGTSIDASSMRVQTPQRTEQTLTTLYEQFRRPIHSYIYRLLGNFEDADDVTQEVFVRACTSWNGLYERERLAPWLYRIATNLCVDLLRRRKRISWWSLSHRYRSEDAYEDVASEDSLAFLSDSGGIPEVAERDVIRQALAQMAPEYATVLVLSAAQGITYQEIAAIVGISPNAAATRISRAKRMFAEQYHHLSKEQNGREEKKS